MTTPRHLEYELAEVTHENGTTGMLAYYVTEERYQETEGPYLVIADGIPMGGQQDGRSSELNQRFAALIEAGELDGSPEVHHEEADLVDVYSLNAAPVSWERGVLNEMGATKWTVLYDGPEGATWEPLRGPGLELANFYTDMEPAIDAAKSAGWVHVDPYCW